MIYLRYISFIFLFLSLLTFFFGYLPKTVYKRRSSRDSSYFKDKTIDKVLLVVIDSLRPDMVYNKSTLWPTLNKTVTQTMAYQTIAELQPPSMSLAKIKCIITGAVISFIEVLFNTDSGKITQENLIDILKHYRNFTIDFYGDETWIKLFPNQFSYSLPLPPFFINDFYGADSQITAHIPKILSNFNAWDFVIMHYLGLDHMGHSVGPFDSYIDRKLSETDRIIGTLLNGTMGDWKNDRNLIILTSDHGMSDLGGHGGSSTEELHVPLIFFNQKFKENPNIMIENLSQNDIAPSLALLLGVPIPADNIGVIPLRLLSLIDGYRNQTNALYSNYFQLTRNFEHLPSSIEKRFSAVNSSIFISHENCGKSLTNKCRKELRQHYRQLISLMNHMKVMLECHFIQHNNLMLEIAFIFSLLALLISTGQYLMDRGVRVTFPGFVFLLAILFLLSTALFLDNFRICLYGAFKISLCIIVIVLTGHSLSGVVETLKPLKSLIQEGLLKETVVVSTLFINFLSFSSETFIKEEHQVWFYLSTTIFWFYFVKEIVRLTVFKNETFQLKSTYVTAIAIIFIDRVLRTLNRTGERWTSTPLLADWLNRLENCISMIIVIFACLLVIGLLNFQRKSVLETVIIELLMILNGCHRYMRIINAEQLADMSVWAYYAVISVYSGLCLFYRFYWNHRLSLRLSNIIMLLCLLICRNQNIILWTGIILKTILVRHIWSQEIHEYNIGVQFVIFNILGMTTFFQQGNSNSLTTIDVQPGFVGMPRYIAALVGPLVAFQLFSGNLYWIITWLEWLYDDQLSNNYELVSTQNKSDPDKGQNKDCDSVPDSDSDIIRGQLKPNILANIVTSLTIISSMFTVNIFVLSLLHRYQMTAWSVYAPKLLYNSFHNGITLILYIFLAMIKFFCSF